MALKRPVVRTRWSKLEEYTVSQHLVTAIRTQFQAAHRGWLEPTMQDVTPEQAHWQPPGGRVAPIGAQYGHHIVAPDCSWALRQPFRAFPPSPTRPASTSPTGKGTGASGTRCRSTWTLRQYAQATYAALTSNWPCSTMTIWRRLSHDAGGPGRTDTGFAAHPADVHAAAHTGETSALRACIEAGLSFRASPLRSEAAAPPNACGLLIRGIQTSAVAG